MGYPKPSQYPKLVPVKDEWYRVCFANKLNDGNLGFCDGEMKLIAISLDQEPKEMLATFFHELSHAAAFEFKLKLGHPIITKLEWVMADAMMLFTKPEPKA